eukprot:m.18975 g.18975  ORF g.18975 m.18975 type:complete len:468 (-) comp11666_c0_seq1:96-1499(-)
MHPKIVRFGSVKAMVLISIACSTRFTSSSKMITSLPRLAVRNGTLPNGLQGPALHTPDGRGSTKMVVLRGANYIRLNGSQGSGPDWNLPVYHSTFSIGKWNRSECTLALERLHKLGYNAVRVFMDSGDAPWVDGGRTNGINGPWNATNLNPSYLDNVANFVRDATAVNVYVIPTLWGLPQSSMFECSSDSARYPNNLLLLPDCVASKAKYAQLFMKGMKARLGEQVLSTIAMISLENEVAYSVAARPFSSENTNTSFGPAANGKHYSLVSDKDRQALADDSLAFWTDTAASAIRSVDPQALVTVGMFTYAAVGKNASTSFGLPAQARGTNADPRVPPRPAVLARLSSGIDVVDLHVYHVPKMPQGTPWNLVADLTSSAFGANGCGERVPTIMGEFGAWKVNPSLFPTATLATSAMVHQQTSSCSFRFSGWLFWTLDTWEQPRLWNWDEAPLLEQQLAPCNRIDPCAQ